MSANSIEESTKKRLGRVLAKTVTQYLNDESHRQDFEQWYLKKYGVQYCWKKRGITND